MTELNRTNHNRCKVELRAARIPWLSLIAVHYWFVVYQDENIERWEVWQKRDQKPPSWGHLHKDLLPATRGVGSGDSWVEQVFEGQDALTLIQVLRTSPDNYPNKYKYRYWPGPNSNSFVQWILDEARLPHHLHPVGIGKNHMGLFGIKKIAGVRSFSTPLCGLRYQKRRFIELHILHLGLSVELKPFRLRAFIYF